MGTYPIAISSGTRPTAASSGGKRSTVAFPMDKPSRKTLRRNLKSYASVHSSVRKLSGHKHKLQVESLAHTRSGSAISGVSTPAQGDAEYLAVFKEGHKRKLNNERKGVQAWQNIYPGLAPQILSYERRGQSAALLLEHLPGMTFERLILEGSAQELEGGMHRLMRTVRSVWKNTKQASPVNAQFMGQLQQRWPRVVDIHPEFQDPSRSICGHPVRAFEAMLEHAVMLEGKIDAPFGVYIHGDFNLDNIIYDPQQGRINFIDLHRSRHFDLAQDVSVFMVSNYRQQIVDPVLRARLLSVALEFYAMARRFARKQSDDTFEWRMAMGLIRSFATSTRFVLDKSHARKMFLRARYLLEQIVDTPVSNAARYKLPAKEIFRV